MKTKILIALIVLIGLGAGGFFAYQKLFVSEVEEEASVVEEKASGVEEEIEEEKEVPEEQTVLPEEEEKEVISEEKVAKKEEKEPALIPIQLTFLENLAADPSWSPDGSKLIFLGLEKDQMKGGLYTINSDGTGITSIGPWERDHLFNPSWSPVSNKVVAYGERENSGLFLVDLGEDWAKRVQLTAQKVEHASWSPDGKKIAYNVYNEDKSFSSIWVMNADGSGKTRLTTDEDGFCTGPSFGYDGLKIVYLKGFTTTMPGEKPDDKILFVRHLIRKAPQIWVINSDGANPQCILDPEEGGIPTAIYDDPVWDNSGTKIAVTKVILSDESWQVATFSWEE